MTKDGVYPSPINTRAHNNMNNEAVNETRLHPTWTKHCRMTIPSYTEQFWVPYVYRQWRLIPASESAIHKNNKAARLKSTKSWDSLNKSYCWQQAAPWVCACMYVNRLLDTFSQWEKVLAERIHTFVWNVYIAPQQRQTPVSSISWRWATMICPGCLSDFLCIWVREGVCVWLHIEWFMVMTQSWPKRTKVEKEAILLCVFLFHICSSKAFISGTRFVPRWQTEGGVFSLSLHLCHLQRAPSWLKLPSRNIGKRSRTAMQCKHTPLTHMNNPLQHSFPLNGEKKEMGGGGVNVVIDSLPHRFTFPICRYMYTSLLSSNSVPCFAPGNVHLDCQSGQCHISGPLSEI